MEGLNGDLDLSSCVMENRLYDGTDKSELIFFKGNDNDSGTLDRIRLRSGQITFDCFNTSSMDRTAEDIKATIDSNSFNINTAQLVVTRPNGNDNDGETAAEHALRITSGNDARTLFMGVDDTDQIGYINCAHTGSTRPICLQTRGSNVGVGNTNPSFKLDITGDVRTTGAMTTSSVNVTSSKKVKNVESSLDDVSTNQEVLDLFNSIPLSKYTYIDKIKNKDFIRYGLIAEDMPNEIYKTETKDFIPNIYQFADISFSNDKYTITFNEKLDISKIQNENSDNILCYFVKNDKYETDKRFILKDFEILDEYSITGNFKNNFEENKIFVYGVEGMIPGVNKDAYFEITSCVVKHLVKENNELKERLNKIEQLLNIN